MNGQLSNQYPKEDREYIQLPADAVIIGLSDIKIINQYHYMVRAHPAIPANR